MKVICRNKYAVAIETAIADLKKVGGDIEYISISMAEAESILIEISAGIYTDSSSWGITDNFKKCVLPELKLHLKTQSPDDYVKLWGKGDIGVDYKHIPLIIGVKKADPV